MTEMSKWLLELDYKILNWIQLQASNAWQDQFFPWLTDLNKSPYFVLTAYPLVIFLFIWKFKRAGISLFLMLLLALGVSDFAGARVKNHYLRLRPFENKEIAIVQKSPAGSKSFYSNHASNMFTFAAYTSSFFPVLSIPLYGLASAISYSRLYNGVHYPTDVVAGGGMGIIWGLCFASIARRLQRRFHKKDVSQ